MRTQSVAITRTRWRVASVLLALLAVIAATIADRAPDARAAFAGSASWTSVPNSGAAGDIVTLQFQLNLSAASTGNVGVEFAAIPGLVPASITSPGFVCPASGLADGQLTATECTSSAPVGAGAHTFALEGVLTGPGTTFGPGVVTFRDGATTIVSAASGSFSLSSVGGAHPSQAVYTPGFGSPVAMTFVVPAGSTCQSDSDSTPDIDIECSLGDLYNPDGLVVTVAPHAVAPDNDTLTSSLVFAEVIASKPGTHIVALRLKQWGPQEPPGIVTAQQVLPFDSVVNYMSYPVRIDTITPELRHMADNATEVVIEGETFGGQDVQSNVRGSRHVVCTVVADTGTITNPTPIAAAIPLNLPNTQITVVPGGGYNGLESVVQPQNPTFTDVQIFTGNGRPVGDIVAGVPGNGGLAGASCFSWVSTGAGDQEISVNFVSSDGVTPVHVDWDTNANGNGEGPVRQNRALIKEWNVLEDSTVTLTGGATGTATGDSQAAPVLTTNVNLVLNPAYNAYQTPNGAPVIVRDVFNGSHVTRSNTVVRTALVGVRWTVAHSGCGVLYDDLLSSAPGANDAQITVQFGPVFRAGDVVRIGAEYMLVTHVSGNTLDVTRGVSLTGAAGGSTAAAHLPGDPVLIASGTTELQADGTVGHVPEPRLNVFGSNVVACSPGSSAEVTFNGVEPGPLGSGQGLRVTETVRFTFSTTVTQKKVFLAWAGNRVILEADWRVLPGDTAALTIGPGNFVYTGEPYGRCQFNEGQGIRYVKGGGPGNFVAGLGAFLNGADEATVMLGENFDKAPTLNGGVETADEDQTEDAPLFPQDACISRVLFESEDPGQVDIEAFAADPIRGAGATAPVDVTKVAFVVYYMKFENVALSLVDDVSKGINHNSMALADWTPGNPWDASKDVTSVNWNVSRDLLVRGRVRGWFVNANPSGRPVNTDDPLNVLPANRWVLPDDWALLAGGPADNANNSTVTGTAEEFRPYYDIMIDPGQGRFALPAPYGAGMRVTTIADWPATASPAGGNTTTTLAVANSNSSSGIKAGVSINIGIGSVTTTKPALSVTNTRNVSAVGFIYNAAGDIIGSTITLTTPLIAVPAAGTPVVVISPAPFEGPYSLIDLCSPSPAFNDCLAGSFDQGVNVAGAALSNSFGPLRDTAMRDGDVDRWDAPMPVAMVSVKIRGTGFIHQVWKSYVYYTGTQNGTPYSDGGDQFFPNPYYNINIPDSPYIPAVVSGGGYLWDSWGTDGAPFMDNGPRGMGPYDAWRAVRIGTNSAGIGDPGLNTDDALELADIRARYLALSDSVEAATISRDLVLYSDNHGEFMVAANGDFKTDLTACAANTLGGGKQCKTGDAVGKGTLTATADYPDFRGKHFPVKSNDAVVTWTWGGYKDVTVENDPAGNAQYKYVVFHAMDRDGFCRPVPSTGMVLLHSVLTAEDAGSSITNYPTRGAKDPIETIDFLIDSGEGIILATNAVPSAPAVATGTINNGRQFAAGVNTFSIEQNDPAQTGILEFPKSSQAAAGATDECQAWIKVSNSLLGVLDVLTVAHDDEGDIAFDSIIDLQGTATFTLNFRWSLVTWTGADATPVADALKGTGANDAGNDISDQVTVVYGWDAPAQDWLGYFPGGVNVPGANDLTKLMSGAAYWIAIKGPGAVNWTIATDVAQ